MPCCNLDGGVGDFAGEVSSGPLVRRSGCLPGRTRGVLIENYVRIDNAVKPLLRDPLLSGLPL